MIRWPLPSPVMGDDGRGSGVSVPMVALFPPLAMPWGVASFPVTLHENRTVTGTTDF